MKMTVLDAWKQLTKMKQGREDMNHTRMTTPSIKRRYKALPTMHCLVWNFLSCRAIVMKVRKKEKKKRSMSQLLSKTLSAMQFFLFYFIFFFLERKAMWMQKIFFMAFLGHFFVFFLLCGQHFDFIF